ncbi:lytic murein transglycosylase [Streptomyces sp. NPDC046261]|uniref:lytic murein transglycosylase n=1 Tax=Streptomyces sp. NPDC046261 TaxID=3157200 RepID=UPI0033F39C1B
MKILRTRAASVSRQGLCAALLVAGLTTAAVGASPPHRAGQGDPSPGPDNPQSRPHGVPNLTLPDLVPRPGTGKPDPNATRGDTPDGATGIPATALAAYKNAEKLAKERYPSCHIPWQLVAGIGKVESEHAAAYGLRSDGLTDRPIRGPRLTGGQFAVIKDTDGGRWDGDKEYDRAVGPTQFIPSTWESFGADGNGDGKQDPNNIFDATAATARYLCSGGKDMNNPGDLDRAILSYNQSREYVNAVLAWMRAYKNSNVGAVPDPSPSRPGTPSWNTPTPPSSRPSKPGSTSPARPAETGRGGTPGKQNPPAKPSPTKPEKPNNPGNADKPGGNGNGGETKPTPPTPTPAPVTRLDRVGDGTLEATANETFTERARVRALDATGRPAPERTRVRFEIIGDTHARFLGSALSVTVPTDRSGLATAPEIHAGDWPGQFTVRATVEGRDITPVDFHANVKTAPARRADTLVRVGEDPLKATPKSTFAQKIQIKALGKDQPIAETAITATVLAKDGKTPAKTGPYFKDTDGKQLRTLALPKTGKDGTVTLPELFTDEQAGTFVLRLATADGTTLTLELTVTAPPAAEPSGSPAPSGAAKPVQ